MAEKTIGIRIQLNGMDTVVQDIETFEQLLKEANQDLKQIPVGSENYKQLAREIGKAKGQLNDLNKTTEGLSSEKIAEGFGKLAGGITASFAAATAAVSLFGNESEAVQKAATEAQNLLTIALSIRGIMEVKTGAQIVARTIAEEASTLATNASSAATKKLYGILAANPYGAIIAAIGLLVSAYLALKSTQDELGKQIVDINKKYDEAKTKNLDQIETIQSLREIVLDTTQSEKRRQQGLEDLKKIMPEITSEHIKQKGALEEIVKVSDVYIKVLKARADAEVANQVLIESNKLLIEEQQKGLKGQINTIEDVITFLGASITLQDQRQARLNAASERYGENLRRIYEVIGQAEVARNKSLENLLDAEAELGELQKISAKNEGDRKKAVERTAEAQKRLIDVYKTRAELEAKIITNLERLNQKDAEVQAEILDRAKEILDEANELVKQRRDFYITETEIFTKEIKDLLFTVVPSPEELKSLQDSYLLGFNLIISSIKDGSIKVLDESGKAISFNLDFIKKKIKESTLPDDIKKSFENLNKEQEKALVEFFTRLSATAEQYSKEFKFGDVIFKPGDEKTIQENLLKLIEGTRKILEDPTILPGEKDIKINQLVKSIFAFPEKLQKDFKDALDAAGNVLEGTGAAAYEKYNEAILTTIKNLTEFGKVQANQVIETDAVAKSLQELVSEILDVRNELGNLDESFVIPNSGKFKLTVEEISSFVDKLTTKLKENPKLLEAFFKDISLQTNFYLERFGQDGILKVFEGIQTGLSNIKDLSRKELQELLTLLVAAQGTIKTEFGDKTALVFEDLILKITKQLKKLPTTAKEEFYKTADEIEKGLQTFNQLLGRLASTVAQYYAFELKKLADENEKQTKAIVGDTEEANQKRIELQKQYETEKAYIEKRALIRSLQFQLVQAIAETAQAVISVIENPVLAGIIAILGGFQIELIRQQLVYAQSLASGGKIKRVGASGLVVGPSHEYGGVSYAMGVNLEGGEAVINKNSSLQYGDLLSSVNQMGGGQPLISNATNSLMEERLIQAIAKTRSAPIRAYVLEQDITKSQTIQRKLDQLATL